MNYLINAIRNIYFRYSFLTKNYLLTFMIIFIGMNAHGQHLDDKRYFNSWIGDWYLIEEGQVSSAPRFQVKKGLNDYSYVEVWYMEDYVAKAWRAWDYMDQKWHFSWISDTGLFQLWEGEKVEDTWYIVKTFVINGEVIRSRQSIVFTSETTMTRVSEHSKNGGETWNERFREFYIKK